MPGPIRSGLFSVDTKTPVQSVPIASTSPTMGFVYQPVAAVKQQAASDGQVATTVGAYFDNLIRLIDQATSQLRQTYFDNATSAYQAYVAPAARAPIAAALLAMRVAAGNAKSADEVGRRNALSTIITQVNQALRYDPKGAELDTLQQIRNLAGHGAPTGGAAPTSWSGQAGTWTPSVGTGVPGTTGPTLGGQQLNQNPPGLPGGLAPVDLSPVPIGVQPPPTTPLPPEALLPPAPAVIRQPIPMWLGMLAGAAGVVVGAALVRVVT